MKTRQIIITSIFLLLIPIAMLINRNMKSGKEQPATSAAVPGSQARKVKVLQVELSDHTVTLPITGKVVAKDRYGIYADVPGRMLATTREFREGVFFSKGDILVRLESGPETEALKARKTGLFNRVAGMIPDLRMTIPAAAEKWEAYLRILTPTDPVPELPTFASEQERLFISARDILNQYFTIRSEEERLQKFVERAPFSGQLTQAAVLPGSYVQPGQKLGELTGTGRFEMETSVPLSELGKMNKGQVVDLTDPANGRSYRANVVRVIQAVDERTQNGRVILDVQGSGLYHGQFLSGEIASARLEDCARIRRTLLLNDDQIFVLRDSTLARQSVRPLAFEAEWVYLEGLTEGTLILDESSPAFQDGLRVAFDQE